MTNDRRIPHIPPSLDNPHTQFNKITTGVVHLGDGWAVTIRMEHSELGNKRNEVSTSRWGSEKAARQAATTIAHTMQARIIASHR